MYIINVKAISDILPRMYAVDFELHPGDLGATVMVSAATPPSAVERAFQLFLEYLREGRRGHVHEIEYAEIEWETGRTFVIQRKRRDPVAQLVPGGVRWEPASRGRKGGQP